MTIPNSVKRIGAFAFWGCSGLTSVTIPTGVTSIGSYAFSRCSSLTSVTIPSSVTSIGDAAFVDCESLTSVTIPSSITSIGVWTFSSCSRLTSVTIPSSVTSIGHGAFQFCSGLTSVTIPSSVTSIGAYAFADCSNLIDFHVDPANSNYSSPGGVLFDKLITVLLEYPEGKDGSYEIPSSVTSIGSSAFSGCSGLTSVTIPLSVTSIGGGAFSWCSGLTSVTIPLSVTSIGGSMFWGCSGLTSVTIPPGVTSIGDYAFNLCSSLTSVTIPASVTSIGEQAFGFCTDLNAVKFLGNSPTMEARLGFQYTASDFKFYYLAGNKGFTTPTWRGYPCVEIATPPAPEIEVQHPVGNVLVDGRAKKSFGTVVVGSTSANKSFVIKNVGAEVLTLLAAPIDGANPQDFTHSKVRNVTVAPGASVPFQVGFTPTVAGTRTAWVRIQSNDADEGSFDIKLTGMGVAP